VTPSSGTGEQQVEWELPRSRAYRSVGTFDGARQIGASRDVHLVEDVAQVRLDCLLTQEQFRGNLGICLAVDDEPRHLEFAFGQRRDARSVDQLA
jgi:hypothetical protein